MNWDDYTEVRKGDKVRLNTELRLGNGWGNEPTILPNGAIMEVTDFLLGFRHAFIYAKYGDVTYRLQYQSLDRVPSEETSGA